MPAPCLPSLYYCWTENWIDRLGLSVQGIFHQKCMSCCSLQHNAVVLKVLKALNVLIPPLHPRLSIIFCPLTYTLRSSAACLLNVPKVTTKKMRDGTSTVLVLRLWSPLSLFFGETCASVDSILLQLSTHKKTILTTQPQWLLCVEKIMWQPVLTGLPVLASLKVTSLQYYQGVS